MKNETITIQKTHKKFKAHGVISVALIVVGIWLMMSGYGVEGALDDGTAAKMTAGTLMTVGGFAYWLVNKIRTWWNHS